MWEGQTLGYRDDAYKCILIIQKIVEGFIIAANGVIIGRILYSKQPGPPI